MRERANERTRELESFTFIAAITSTPCSMLFMIEDVEHTVRTHTTTGREALWSFGLRVHEISQRKRGIEIYRYHTYTVYTIQHRVFEPTVSVCISL